MKNTFKNNSAYLKNNKITHLKNIKYLETSGLSGKNGKIGAIFNTIIIFDS